MLTVIYVWCQFSPFFEDAPDTTILTTVPSNRTLLRDSIISLNCKTDASPEAEYHVFFNDNLIGISSSGVFNTTVMADGVYTCVPINTVGTGENATVSITVVGKLHSTCFQFSFLCVWLMISIGHHTRSCKYHSRFLKLQKLPKLWSNLCNCWNFRKQVILICNLT